MMIDIDHFKRFNDTHGHMAGNRALEHVARILEHEVRETDLLARYGGEEFTIVLPETTKRKAGELAERIRTHIEAKPVHLDGGRQETLTLSLGVATYSRDALNSATLLESADEALYISKKLGRNRTSFFLPNTGARVTYTPEQTRSVRTVHLIGAFNGWDSTADPLQRDEKGVYSLTLQLAPGHYVYKFLINGDYFISDPLCFEYVLDGYGGRNSVLSV
jgi:diguanylate cyclase (GGDEF)-like protein